MAADYRSRRAKGRGTKCDDAAESSIRELGDLGLIFLQRRPDLAPQGHTAMRSTLIMARAGWRGRGMGREDAIGVNGSRGAGSAASPLPSRLLGGRFSPPLPRVEEIGLRHQMRSDCPDLVTKPDSRRIH